MENKKYAAAVFDLDGTLLNTIDDLADAVNAMLERYCHPTWSTPEIMSFVGNGMERLVRLSLPEGVDEAEVAERLVFFKEYYSKHMLDKTRPYEGVSTLLRELRSRGVRTAIVSNKADAATRRLAADFFGPDIEIAVGESADVRRKPAPDSVFAVLKSLGVQKSQALYIGDSEVDIATAKNAGLDFLGVSWGFRGREALASGGALTVVDSPAEIARFF